MWSAQEVQHFSNTKFEFRWHIISCASLSLELGLDLEGKEALVMVIYISVTSLDKYLVYWITCSH